MRRTNEYKAPVIRVPVSPLIIRNICSRSVDRPIILAFRARDSGSNPDGSTYFLY